MSAGQDGGIVAEVGVHLDDARCAALERDREPVEVRPAEALLRRPVTDAYALVGGGELVGEEPVPSGESSSTTISDGASGSASEDGAP